MISNLNQNADSYYVNSELVGSIKLNQFNLRHFFKSQGKIFLSFLYTLFFLFWDLKNYLKTWKSIFGSSI